MTITSQATLTNSTQTQSNAPLNACSSTHTLFARDGATAWDLPVGRRSLVNVFSSEPFLSGVRDALFGGSGSIAGVEIDGRTVRTLVTDRGPCLDHPLIDFFEPTPDDALHRATFAPRISVDRIDRQTWRDVPQADATPAPMVDWSRFASWAEFEVHTRATVKRLWASDRRERRRLEDEHGPVRYVAATDGGPVLDQCLRWKSAQYQRNGAKDLFADRRNRDLVSSMFSNGIGELHGLYAGDRLIAAQVGMRLGGRSYSWFPSYDTEYHRYSPGRLLLHDALRASYARGDTEFDFLIGDEEYKWLYATDTRIIRAIGRPGLGYRAHDLRVQLSRRYPRANHAAKRVLRHGRNLQARWRMVRG